MKRLLIIAAAVAAASVILYLTVYRKRGPAEEFGRTLDEGIEKMRHGDETEMQKACRKLREAADDIKKKMQ